MNFTLAILLAVTAAYGLALIMWEVGLYPRTWVAPLTCFTSTFFGIRIYDGYTDGAILLLCLLTAYAVWHTAQPIYRNWKRGYGLGF